MTIDEQARTNVDKMWWSTSFETVALRTKDGNVNKKVDYGMYNINDLLQSSEVLYIE